MSVDLLIKATIINRQRHAVLQPRANYVIAKLCPKLGTAHSHGAAWPTE